MPSTSDISKAASILARVQEYLTQKGVEEHDDDLNSMIDLFESPIFRQMVQLRNSIDTLNKEAENESFNPNDVEFAIDSGALVVGGKERLESNDLADALIKEPLENLKEYVRKEANGRLVEEIELFKYPNESLGFSVIGLRSDYRGDLGIFVNELTPGGMASRDGRLKEEDQILAINSTPLSPTGSHQQAIQLLQSCKGLVKLIVARGAFPQGASKPSNSQSSASTSDLSSLTQETAEINWSHVETIELTNTGQGLGFGIVGGRATGGVVVKTIVSGGAADRDGRLCSGDHILRIEDTDLQDMNSEQVAVVLRKCGANVRLMVARRGETEDDTEDDVQDIQTEIKPPPIQPRNQENRSKEIYEVELVKDTKGLGITISGCLQEDADDFEETGVFVNGIKPGSASDIDGQIKEGDQIIAVDGHEFEGMSSEEAVQVLRNTGVVVRLTMARLICFGTSNLEQQDDETQEIVYSNDVEVNADYTDVVSQQDPDDVIIEKWSTIMGDEYEIIVAQMRKFNYGSGLGISLEGRLDIHNFPHHYLRSILPEGPVGLHGKLKVGDELLEVNNDRLLGLNHVEVVVILKELPINVRMVCARPLTIAEASRDTTRDSVVLQENEEGEFVELKPPSEADESNQQQWESSAGDFVTSSALSQQHEVETSSLSSSSSEIHSSTPQIRLPGIDQLGLEASGPEPMSQSPVSMERGSFGSYITPRPSETTIDTFEEIYQPIPMFAEVSEHWNSNIEYIDLYKKDANSGLGFSILELPEQEYERTAVVVSGLLEGGVAHTDGRLEPGDRLVFVNNVDLTSSDLDQAVNALKSIPSGNVKIGIVKPKPQFKDQFFNEDIEEEDEDLEDEHIHDIPDVVTALEESVNSEDTDIEVELEKQHEEIEQSITPSSIQEVEHSLPKQTSTSSNNNYEVKQIKMSGMTAIAITTTNQSNANQQSDIRANTPSPQPPVVPPKPQNYHPTYNSAPSWQHSHQSHQQKSEGYERMVHLNKGDSSLGLSVRPDKEGDGLLVVKVTEGGAVSLAGEPQPGDMIRKMNHDSAVGLGSMQARSLIINHSKYSQHVAISYIPSYQIQAFKSGVPYLENQQQQPSVNEEPPSRRQQFAAIKSIFEQPKPFGQDDMTPRISQIEPAQLSSSMWGTYQGVEIVKDHQNDNLGLEIVGGRGEEMPLLASGEPLQGIFVSLIEEGGCLHRDGRIKPGDKILKVGMFDLTNASHQEAIEAFEEQQKTLRTSLIIQSFISKSLKPSSIFESLRHYRITYKEHQKESDNQYIIEDTELLRKYSHVPGEKSVIRLHKGPSGLGISMAGNKEKFKFIKQINYS